jgi:hypothetical protein
MRNLKRSFIAVLMAVLFLGCRETSKNKEVYGEEKGNGFRKKQMESMEEAKERSEIGPNTTKIVNDSSKTEVDSTKPLFRDPVSEKRKPF